jgi:hypothetical protein
VKKTLISLAATAMAVLLLAPGAMAQYQAPALDPMPGFNQPDYTNPAFDNPDIPTDGATAPASPSSSTATPAATTSPSATASPSASASPSVAASPSASASTSATSSATPSASASASTLPDTGGTPLFPALAVVAFVVLAGSGILAQRLVRGRDAAS